MCYELSTQYEHIHLPLYYDGQFFKMGHSCAKLYLFEIPTLEMYQIEKSALKLRVLRYLELYIFRNHQNYHLYELFRGLKCSQYILGIFMITILQKISELKKNIPP